MSRDDEYKPAPAPSLSQGKRPQDSNLDWETGWSKKKLATGRSSSSSERQEQAQPEAAQPAPERPTFKAVGHIVMAMKRFQAALNPTYTYGKVSDTNSSGTSSGFVHPAQRIMKKSDSFNSTAESNKKSLHSRGNRTNLLFKQLADPPQAS